MKLLPAVLGSCRFTIHYNPFLSRAEYKGILYFISYTRVHVTTVSRINDKPIVWIVLFFAPLSVIAICLLLSCVFGACVTPDFLY